MSFFDKILNNTQKTDTTPAPTPTTPPKKVLIVEDDKYLRDFYAELLCAEGLQVITAENGQIGLESVMSQKPNIVLLDLMMPVMDGKTMLHKMREIPEFKATPVIVLTNAGDADNMTQTQKYDNAKAFLIKSNIAPEEILRVVKTLI